MSGADRRSLRRTRRPKSTAELVGSTLRSLRISEKLERYAAFPLWPQIAGEEIARRAVPEKITRARVLVVRVLDASWAQELSLRKPELLEKIHEIGVGAAIEDIRFVTGDPTTFPKG